MEQPRSRGKVEHSARTKKAARTEGTDSADPIVQVSWSELALMGAGLEQANASMKLLQARELGPDFQAALRRVSKGQEAFAAVVRRTRGTRTGRRSTEVD